MRQGLKNVVFGWRADSPHHDPIRQHLWLYPFHEHADQRLQRTVGRLKFPNRDHPNQLFFQEEGTSDETVLSAIWAFRHNFGTMSFGCSNWEHYQTVSMDKEQSDIVGHRGSQRNRFRTEDQKGWFEWHSHRDNVREGKSVPVWDWKFGNEAEGFPSGGLKANNPVLHEQDIFDHAGQHIQVEVPPHRG